MAKSRNSLLFPPCPLCGRGLRGDWKVIGMCAGCARRRFGPDFSFSRIRPPDLQARIKYYQSRAEKGLPLFSPPFSEDVA